MKKNLIFCLLAVTTTLAQKNIESDPYCLIVPGSDDLFQGIERSLQAIPKASFVVQPVAFKKYLVFSPPGFEFRVQGGINISSITITMFDGQKVTYNYDPDKKCFRTTNPILVSNSKHEIKFIFSNLKATFNVSNNFLEPLKKDKWEGEVFVNYPINYSYGVHVQFGIKEIRDKYPQLKDIPSGEDETLKNLIVSGGYSFNISNTLLLTQSIEREIDYYYEWYETLVKGNSDNTNSDGGESNNKESAEETNNNNSNNTGDPNQENNNTTNTGEQNNAQTNENSTDENWQPKPLNDPFQSNSYDYFSVEEMRKSQKDATYYMESFTGMVHQDIERKNFTNQLNEVMNQSLPLDPLTLIQNQDRREQEAIDLLEQKQNAARRASSEQELRAISSARNPTELSVLTGTASVMKVVNEITFRKEREKLLAKLKAKREVEMDKLYQKTIAPLTNSRDSYERKAIFEQDPKKEELALAWRNYYHDMLMSTKRAFSYNNTQWAVPSNIAQNATKPLSNYYSSSSTSLGIPLLTASAKQKMAGLQNPEQYLLGKSSSNDFDTKNIQALFSPEILYQGMRNPRLSLPVKAYSSTQQNLVYSSRIVLGQMLEKDPKNAWAMFHLGLLTYEKPVERKQLLNCAFALATTNKQYREEALWNQALFSDDLTLFQDYLNQFPTGVHTDAANSYLNYRKTLSDLDKVRTEQGRIENNALYHSTRENGWYRSNHWTQEKAFHETAAKIDYGKLKNLKDGLYNDKNVEIIERYIEKYESTSYASKAQVLLSNARAKRKFNYADINFGINPVAFIAYSEEFSDQAQNSYSKLADEGATTLAFKLEVYFHRAFFSLNKKGTLAFGMYGGGQMELYAWQTSMTFTEKGTFSTDKSYDGRMAMGDIPVPEVEFGLGLSRYLYAIGGYKRYISQSTSNFDEEKKYKLFSHPLVGENITGANALFYGVKSEIPLGKASVMGSYRKYNSALGSEQRLQGRLNLAPTMTNGAPLSVFFQYETNVSSSRYSVAGGNNLFVKKLKYNYVTIGVRLGGPIY